MIEIYSEMDIVWIHYVGIHYMGIAIGIGSGLVTMQGCGHYHANTWQHIGSQP